MGSRFPLAVVADLSEAPISLNSGGVGTVMMIVSFCSLLFSAAAGFWGRVLGQIRSVFLGLGVSALGYILVGSLPRSL